MLPDAPYDSAWVRTTVNDTLKAIITSMIDNPGEPLHHTVLLGVHGSVRIEFLELDEYNGRHTVVDKTAIVRLPRVELDAMVLAQRYPALAQRENIDVDIIIAQTKYELKSVMWHSMAALTRDDDSLLCGLAWDIADDIRIMLTEMPLELQPANIEQALSLSPMYRQMMTMRQDVPDPQPIVDYCMRVYDETLATLGRAPHTLH